MWTLELQEEFERLLASEGPGMPEVWLLLDATTPDAQALAARYPRCHVFSEERLRELPYARLNDRGIINHCHFPLLDFHLTHSSYDHYWLVEYDVRYTGAWQSFLAPFADDAHDLITCHLRRYVDEPRLSWWWTFGHPTRTLPREQWWRSFNVAYRVSARALAYVDGELRDGWRGHPEILLPTLLLAGGFSVLDLGGNGRLARPGWAKRFYTSESSPRGRLSPLGTLTFRPSRARPGWRRDKLYHPVKPRALREPWIERWWWRLRYARDRLRYGRGWARG